MPRPTALIAVLLASVVVSCAPGPGQTSAPQSSPAAQSRTQVIAHRYEVATLAPKVLQNNGPTSTTRLFNAALTLIDDQGLPRPYLAESLPQLNTDTWRVFPDGRMETTYFLRNNLSWQDGAPLTAEDFVFGFRVYQDPNLAVFTSTPQDTIAAVLAPDSRTLVIQWRSPNPGGGTLTLEELDPLPIHLLEAAFNDFAAGSATGDAFLGSSFWTIDYVGAGPYRLHRWDPGAQIEGVAFDGHALGRPKIERLVIRIFSDENVTLTAVLAGGQVDFTNHSTLRFDHFVTLKREWEPAGKGTAVTTLGTAVFLFLQQRPEYVGDRALLDLRVRRALAHTIDRQSINEGLFDGISEPTETPVPPNVPFYPEVDRVLTKYPLDVNRATQLMREAGFAKDAEGYFADGQSRRFHIDFAVQNSTEIERMQAILSDSWRRAGFDVRTAVVQSRLFTQGETRQTLPGLGYALFSAAESTFRSSEVGSPANRWSGSNRGGWTSPDYDRFYEAWSSTLDATERGRNAAQLMGLVSEHLPGYALYFPVKVRSWVSSLQGPAPRFSSGFGQTSRGTTDYWDIQDWTFR